MTIQDLKSQNLILFEVILDTKINVSLNENMTVHQLELWNAIKRFELDEPEVSLNFTARLARENGWTIEYSLRAIVEYKKFIFLLTISNHPLTPSDQVDQVWHLHLLYTQSYWEDLCEKILKRKIHHGPTKGGTSEQDKFADWYEKTKALYLETFKVVAPTDIWPSSEVRFSEIEFQRVNLKHNWIIKKLFS